MLHRRGSQKAWGKIIEVISEVAVSIFQAALQIICHWFLGFTMCCFLYPSWGSLGFLNLWLDVCLSFGRFLASISPQLLLPHCDVWNKSLWCMPYPLLQRTLGIFAVFQTNWQTRFPPFISLPGLPYKVPHTEQLKQQKCILSSEASLPGL